MSFIFRAFINEYDIILCEVSKLVLRDTCRLLSETGERIRILFGNLYFPVYIFQVF